ncbi:MAG: YraN family protein [Candidatus Sumerlaeia bacterium]|nr:YraN family protein [Candidatus Sumerlaeia bacterium]
MRILESLRNLWGRPRAWHAEWTRAELGRWGEECAAWHYWRTRGGAVLARNWRGGGGELDLVVREGDVLVFVEVKARRPQDADPLVQVRDAHRQRNWRGAAAAYLATLPRPRPAVRFDAVVVLPDPQNPHQPRIEWHGDVMASIHQG